MNCNITLQVIIYRHINVSLSNNVIEIIFAKMTDLTIVQA